jgi:5-methylcytosine-specific restriction endonuclease McrA
MHVDHIDGDRTNNTYDNLRILCPNCHSQTPTFASKNVSTAGKKKMAESARKNGRGRHD